LLNYDVDEIEKQSLLCCKINVAVKLITIFFGLKVHLKSFNFLKNHKCAL